ncbi:MAG: hypothetical protein DRI90_24115 [Deltaproteobacteria bacterium]|nr:MAG: hypothetical protein DRI90_24115 [Deltaproteobacteria bacterium]
MRRRLGGDLKVLVRVRPPLLRIWRRFGAATRELVKANLPLVVYLAKKTMHHRVPFADLVQEGNIGMMLAAERFDPRFGVRFATYAGWWVRQAMRRATHVQGPVVRFPVAMAQALIRASYEASRLRDESAREPKLEELAEQAGCDADRLRRTVAAGYGFVSLDAPLGDDGRDATRLDFLVGPQEVSPDEAAGEEERRRIVASVLDTLRPREQTVLRMHFGLGGGRTHTLNDIGKVIHVTRERTRQIEVAALEKLRNRLRPYGF